uniref:fimbrial biogenesis chaperone n=1 Tax=Hafnia alvei TaxID=569 RepID=UPI00242C74D4|nr:fimbria/pilus periplasmic chaperone [Hafnia alvei]
MKTIVNKLNEQLVFVILILSAWPLIGHTAVMIGGTRFIFNENSERSLSVLVRNTDSTQMLVQSKVLADNTPGNTKNNDEVSKTKIPFVATPPLLQLRGKKENYIRLIRTDGMLPSDRESLFQLSVAFIPSGMPSGDDVQVAIRSRYKLINRPSGLNGDPKQAYQQLKWQRHGSSVTVENPTPYYVTLFQMVVNEKLQPAEGVVAPFGSRTESWCPKNGGCSLKWQSLDDLGTPTPAWVITPSGIANIGKAIANTSSVATLKQPDEKNSEAHSSPILP